MCGYFAKFKFIYKNANFTLSFYINQGTRELPGIALVNILKSKFLWEMETLSFMVKNQAMQSSNTDYEQSTEAISIKPTPKQLQELYFQQRYHTLLSAFPLDRLL